MYSKIFEKIYRNRKRRELHEASKFDNYSTIVNDCLQWIQDVVFLIQEQFLFLFSLAETIDEDPIAKANENQIKLQNAIQIFNNLYTKFSKDQSFVLAEVKKVNQEGHQVDVDTAKQNVSLLNNYIANLQIYYDKIGMALNRVATDVNEITDAINAGHKTAKKNKPGIIGIVQKLVAKFRV